MPYTTRVVWRRFDVGDVGMRIAGVVWLLSALAWMAAGLGLMLGAAWWPGVTVAAALFSSIPCLLALPETKYGLLINLAVLGFVYLNGQYAWL